MNTVYKYEKILGTGTVAENRDEGSFIWENEYDRESHINEYALTLFLRQENGLYEKSEEIHYQRAYSLEEITEALAGAGLELLKVYDAYTRNEPQKTSERLTFVAREYQKAEKYGMMAGTKETGENYE